MTHPNCKIPTSHLQGLCLIKKLTGSSHFRNEIAHPNLLMSSAISEEMKRYQSKLCTCHY
ncbi:uncharacterized protein PHALS_15006 [Plasmopara halstedii]|uniref:Uncharacterized protein n=1 Tax=Plasmopara halstedii TaxID=4781 RepID=A0A0P1B1A0_PLAHL|nr:uncharacterized protein PHALS_15006 [Plasmopara halstedii]CEG47478.1 hypothetical protein PHALS_15006 [Plasmopara halstedii]|eukprot:XP_024583847.1 hypothetical protein PHALS_15006 [Plasmopara halstedii]